MATPHACAALVDVFPDLLRTRRTLVGSTHTPAVVALAVVLQRGPLRVSEVAEHLSLDLSTVSRQVTHLKTKGLLTSEPDPVDGRSQRLSVTEAGIEELRTFRRSVVDRLVEHLDGWDDGDVDDLTRLLGRLTHDTECLPRPTAASPQTTPTTQETTLQAHA